MPDDRSKAGIPAWQRAYQGKSEPEAGQETSNGPASSAPGAEESTPSAAEGSTAPANSIAAGDSVTAEASSTSQLQNVQAFLEDPAVKDAPFEKKKAFLQSKGVTEELIDQTLGSQDAPFTSGEFDDFKARQSQSAPPAHQRPTPTGPPIITYPEFLVDAHKPPPLITPGRVLSTVYIASGFAALLYGASKYLVTPMAASLTEARHDLASHSQSKIDEMNDRLSKIVSKVPEPKGDKTREVEVDEGESDTSDPTELYHRDMGTQTSPPPSRRASSAGTGADGEKKDHVAYQSNTLDIMKEHLSEMLQRADNLGNSNKERLDSVNKLRHYLDTLQYSSPYSGLWNSAEDAPSSKDSKQDDPVEDLKKDIRAVKGVLLSAKRFPGVMGRAGA